MANLTKLNLTSGTPTDTGIVSTIDALMADGGQVTIGATTDVAATAGGTGSLSAKLRAISRDLVTNVVLAAGNNLIGLFKVSDGVNSAAVKAANTPAQASDPALVVALSPNSVNPDGRALPSACAPIVGPIQYIQACPAGATTTFGTTGAVGDYIDFLICTPANTSPGNVQIQDGAGTAITLFPGGASSVASTIPFTVPIKAVSKSGPWKIITGTGISVAAVGNGT